MLILLPPSETKAAGGDGAPLDLDALGFPSLTPLRRELSEELVGLAADPDASAIALGLGRNRDDEVARNRALWTSPTLPAVRRYTGVLYDALDAASLDAGALGRLAVGSALFGVVRATDPIPAYRLSAGSKLPGRGTLRSRWKPLLVPALAEVHGLVVDLRSGGYSQLGPVAGAVTASVVTEFPDGSRKVVSHFNKHHKGLLARALASGPECETIEDVAALAEAAGLRIELPSPTLVCLVTPGRH